MSRNNTGNPIGSKAFPDFEDNVKNLDEAVNTADPQWVDRFGRFRLPLMEQERRFIASQDSRDDQFQSAQSSRESVFSDFLQGSGYQDLGEYAPGIEITAHNQYVAFGGQPYLLKPSIPVPYTTSGEWTGDDFKLIGDDSLRQDLANPGIGAAMVARGVVAVDSISDLLALPEGQRKEGLRYLVKGYYAGSDVGGGEFYWAASSTEDENGGTVFGDEAQGRWKRKISDYITPQMLGASASPSVDDKDYLTNAIAIAAQSSVKCFIPAREYSINVDGLRGIELHENAIVDIDPGAVFRAIPTDNNGYNIFWFGGTENNVTVRFNGAAIIGDRNDHIGTAGEQGHGIGMRSCKKVRIYDPVIKDCWGDGIYVGGSTPPEEIYIHKPICDNNRRQGISVIQAKNLTIFEPRLMNTNGTSPESGIDFEPNLVTDTLQGVRLIRPYTYNNAGGGIIFYMGPLDSTSPPVDIQIESPMLDSDRFVVVQNGSGAVRGTVIVKDAISINSGGAAFAFRRCRDDGVLFKMIRPVAHNPNQTGGSSVAYMSAFTLEAGSNDFNIGGVELINPSLLVDAGESNAPPAFLRAEAPPAFSIKNFKVIDPVSAGPQTIKMWITGGVNPTGVVVRDGFEVCRQNISTSATAVQGPTYVTSVTGTHAVTLAKSPPVGQIIVLKGEIDGGGIQVSLDHEVSGGERIYPGSLSRIRVNADDGKGARLVLARVVGGYHILEKIGNWVETVGV